MGNGLHDFFGFLMEGLKVVVYTLQNIEFSIEANSFSFLDFVTYGAVISSTLKFISSRYKGQFSRPKTITRKVGKE